MKKFILTAAIAAFGLSTAVAQDGFQGKSFIMGSFGVNTKDNKGADTKTTNFNITPIAGYFIAPTTAIGLSLGYANGKIDDKSGASKVTTKKNSFTIMPLVRQYFAIGSEKVFLFGQVHVPITFGDEKEGSEKKTKYTNWGVNIAPGIDVFLTGNWSVEAYLGGIGYNSSKPKDGKATNEFDFGVDFTNIQLGLKYIF